MKKTLSIAKRTWYFIVACIVLIPLFVGFGIIWCATLGKVQDWDSSAALKFKEQPK